MSEFQSHEWQTVDRPLTNQEQAAVDNLSSHIEVSASRAVVTYHWSSFRHDPKEVLLKYFDAYFYLANWGSRRLMFRFPNGLLETDEIEPYCYDEYTTLETAGAYQVLDIDLNPEDGGEWIDEGDADLSDFISLRADLLEGDYRLLYLAWLAAQTLYGTPVYEEEDDEEWDLEPPVPPGLKKLTPALYSFARLFDIDPFLIQAAAEASPDRKASPTPIDARGLISRLPRAECDDFLVRLADGDPGVRLALRKRLSSFTPKEAIPPAQPRRLRQLVERAEALEKADNERQAQEAHRRHIAEMKNLAQREPQAWREVDELLARGQKSASVYDQATALLVKLQQLAEFQDTRDMFLAHIRGLANKYASRPSLMGRWKQKGWL